MPELPEVETVVRGLRLALPGRTIEKVRLGKTDFIDDPSTLEAVLPGSRILEITRRGKFIVLLLEKSAQQESAASGHAPVAGRFHFLIHLGMTGQLTVRPAEAPSPPHTHAFFALDNGSELRFADIRRFGRMLVVPERESAPILGPLGIDPLEMSVPEFSTRIRSRKARIKALLLDQHVFRGMGNIYTDESLWRARIHPARLGVSLGVQETRLLYRAVQSVLREAIRLGGSTISDYVNAEGLPGEFQIRHRVYQREGKKCSRCGTLIRRIIVAGRSSYFCKWCQRAPRKRRSTQRAKAL